MRRSIAQRINEMEQWKKTLQGRLGQTGEGAVHTSEGFAWGVCTGAVAAGGSMQ
ncbi:hypothetical protein [Agrobacterium tumefaciens]|uniref:hypothetical protein n=1 Tax=Agrobacterium tumefaciens TaxID=358 RepID=UPI0013AFE00C|nr:hypothetical protein [Agrobacterium tumefaciens]MEA1844592.1 hypothetical protein [Agrobacterium tumefaciens]